MKKSIYIISTVLILFCINSSILFAQNNEKTENKNDVNNKKENTTKDESTDYDNDKKNENKEELNNNKIKNKNIKNQNESYDELYVKAFILENDQWKLKEASQIYKKIIDNAPNDSKLYAKSQLRLGITYVKLKKYKLAKKHLKIVSKDFKMYKKIHAQSDFYLGKIKEIEDKLIEKDKEGQTDFLVYCGFMGFLTGLQIPTLFVDNPDSLKAWPLLFGAIGAGIGVGGGILLTYNENISQGFGTVLTIGFFHGYFYGNVLSFLYLKPYVKDASEESDDWKYRGKIIAATTIVGTISVMLGTYYLFKDEELTQGETYLIDSLQLWGFVIGAEISLVLKEKELNNNPVGAGLAGIIGMSIGVLGASLANYWSDLTYNQAKTIGRSTGAGTLAALMFLLYDPRSIISFKRINKYENNTIGWILLGGTSLGLIASSIGIAIWGEDAVIKEKKRPIFLWEEEQDAIQIGFLEPRVDYQELLLPTKAGNANYNLIYGVGLLSVEF